MHLLKNGTFFFTLLRL